MLNSVLLRNQTRKEERAKKTKTKKRTNKENETETRNMLHDLVVYSSHSLSFLILSFSISSHSSESY